MPFQPGKPRSSSVLASVLAAAGIVLTVASCSHVTPLGPTPPPPRHLGSPIVLRAVLSGPRGNGQVPGRFHHALRAGPRPRPVLPSARCAGNDHLGSGRGPGRLPGITTPGPAGATHPRASKASRASREGPPRTESRSPCPLPMWRR